MSDGGRRSYTWRTIWSIIAGLAVVLAVLTGAVALWDRFAPAPAPVATPSPSPRPQFTGDLSTLAGASAFVDFATTHDGQPVELDLACDDVARDAACTIESDIDGWTLLYVFTGERCALVDTDTGPPIDECDGANVVWIDLDTDGSSAFMANGPGGAGTYVIRGRFGLRDQGAGGSVFPPNVHSFRLVALAD